MECPHVMSGFATQLDFLKARDEWHVARIADLERERDAAWDNGHIAGREKSPTYRDNQKLRDLIDELDIGLAAAQATIARKDEALTKLESIAGTGSNAKEIAQEALALPTDRTCLDAMLAEARKDGMLKAAGICDIESDGYGGIVDGPIASERGKQVYQAMSAGAANCADAIRQAAERSE